MKRSIRPILTFALCLLTFAISHGQILTPEQAHQHVRNEQEAQRLKKQTALAALRAEPAIQSRTLRASNGQSIEIRTLSPSSVVSRPSQLVQSSKKQRQSIPNTSAPLEAQPSSGTRSIAATVFNGTYATWSWQFDGQLATVWSALPIHQFSEPLLLDTSEGQVSLLFLGTQQQTPRPGQNVPSAASELDPTQVEYLIDVPPGVTVSKRDLAPLDALHAYYTEHRSALEVAHINRTRLAEARSQLPKEPAENLIFNIRPSSPQTTTP